MKKSIFTNTLILKLKPDNIDYCRSEGNGFTIRVMPSGVKTWLYLYSFNDKRRKLNLGHYPKLVGTGECSCDVEIDVLDADEFRAHYPCRQKAVYASGRCKWHGGLSTGSKTAEGKKKSSQNGLWGRRGKPKLSE